MEAVGLGHGENLPAEQTCPYSKIVIFEIDEEGLVEAHVVRQSRPIHDETRSNQRIDCSHLSTIGDGAIFRMQYLVSEKVIVRAVILHGIRVVCKDDARHRDCRIRMFIERPAQPRRATSHNSNIVVDNHDTIGSRLVERRIPGRRRTAILAQADNPDFRELLLGELRAAIIGRVVEDDNFVKLLGMLCRSR